MLVNVSYQDGFFYVWGITEKITVEKNNKVIGTNLKVLKKIAERCVVKKKYLLGPKTLDVRLPTINDMVDVTGKSETFETYQVKAYVIDFCGFDPFAPTRIKKEFPKKEFINIYFSNSFTLLHLLMRIAGELVDARSYYVNISQSTNKINVAWNMYLDEKIRYYIQHLTSEMPEVFFLFKPQEVGYFEFIRTMLDLFVQAIQSRVQKLDDRAIKKLPKLEKNILEGLTKNQPSAIPLLDLEYNEKDIHNAMLSPNDYACRDHLTHKLLLSLVPHEEEPHTYLKKIKVISKATGKATDWQDFTANQSTNFYVLSQLFEDYSELKKEINEEENIKFEHLSKSLEEFKNIQTKTGCAVSLPDGMTHIAVAPTADVTIDAPENIEEDVSLFSPTAIANVKWKILLGDQQVTLEELQKLADEKKMHYMNGDILIPIDPEKLHLFLKHVKKIQKQKLTPFDLLRADVGLGINYNIASGWLKKVFDQLKGQTPIKDLAQPKGLDAVLRPYQVRGFSWLSFMRQVGLGACLADDMGLGKTIQTIAYILHTRQIQTSKKLPFLLVCPTSLLSNWQRELSVFSPSLNVVIHHGTDRKKEEFDADIVITSYSLVDRDLSFLEKQVWDAVILDEAQNIKNADTKQTQAVKSLKARHRIVLTGTPIENKPTDIWSLMDFINHGLLGSKSWFNTNYSKALSYSNKTDQQEDAKKIAQQLKIVVGPFMLRRLKTDKTIILDLPDKIKHRVICSLSLEQTSLYKACVDTMLKELESLDGLARRGLIFKTLMQLKQICNHPGHFSKTGLGESGKLDVLHDLLDDILEANEKALVFTQFKEMGDLLVKDLEKRTSKKVLFLNGSTPAKDRGNMVKSFQENEENKIFILSLKAGGTGLNLTAANHVVHYDRWWNPAVEEQATSRAHRIGQEKIVSVHTFICEGTIEDRIDMMIEKKIALADSVVGEGEGWITELNDKELKELLTLKEAS
ncbi:MAG: DEAD/DEAH box helicase family protein [Proteobacteria bacterium]|nr:DEAD/DEAH box helicase family protein [Pseudomonadota bacterium]